MPFTIDHIVIAVADLDAAARDYEALGFTVLPGGEHPRGSRNVLVVLADGAYLEIIAFPKPVPGFRWWEVFQAAGPGFVDYALLPGAFDSATPASRSKVRSTAAGSSPTAAASPGAPHARSSPIFPFSSRTSRRATCACRKVRRGSIAMASRESPPSPSR